MHPNAACSIMTIWMVIDCISIAPAGRRAGSHGKLARRALRLGTAFFGGNPLFSFLRRPPNVGIASGRVFDLTQPARRRIPRQGSGSGLDLTQLKRAPSVLFGVSRRPFLIFR